MPDHKVGYMKMTDDLTERFSIPEETLSTPKGNSLLRMEMLGF